MLSITRFRINHRETTLGLDEPSPDFSWILSSEDKNVHQTAYRLLVSIKGTAVWDTGCVTASQSIAVRWAGPPLLAQTRYDVHLTVWDNRSREASAQTWFETGLLDPSAFGAMWITHAMSVDNTACPVFVKSFS